MLESSEPKDLAGAESAPKVAPETPPQTNSPAAVTSAPAAAKKPAPAPAAEALPASTASPRQGKTKLGNTGALVEQDDKIGQGCLCFAPPGGKKNKKGQRDTMATDAATYVGPGPAGDWLFQILPHLLLARKIIQATQVR